ncbi:MAG: glycosyl transferase [Elainellaceae cyanobacterium]
MQPIIYVAITNHGFGHATRTAAVAAEIQRLRPDTTLILTTTAPRWLLESYITGDFIHRPRSFDIGVVQSDSITMDKPATLAKLQQIQGNQAATVASEAAFLKQNRVDLVLADIPPLAAPIARQAGVPCWMASNFGWDFVYRVWGSAFTEVADWISDCYSQCDRLFRLPFYEPMSAFPHVEDVGLTGGSPRWSADELRQEFDVNPEADKTVLLTFGGLGLAQIPYAGLKRFEGWQFITFDRAAPDLPHLLKVTDQRYRPVDMLPLCDLIVSKPGYGTFSEACLHDVPLISITRDDFAEAPVLIEGIRRSSAHRIISPERLVEGGWSFLEEPLTPPTGQEMLPKNGNQVIAQAVIDAVT